jgi:hypothetical protein
MKGLILAVCCALALLVPVAAADAATGSTSNKGKVAVGATIKRFAVVDRKIVARGVLTSRVSGGGQTQAARTPVTFAVAAQRGRCSVLSRTTFRLARGADNAHARKVVRALNSRLEDHPMHAFRASAVLARDEGASAAQAPTTCQVLHLALGPLDLNLLCLVVQLYGPTRNQPVTLDITGTRGGGLLGDLFCSLGSSP